ncbi:MAG: hypothetical protein H0U76_06805 [Ktedonobacteraceae bacterium]|nr:hypothetical protein [Ktedonobacteraceae bacterium]
MSSLQNTSAIQKANRSCAVAIVCLSVALLSFGVGVFINRPESVSGVIFTILGVLFALSGSVFFARFNHYSKKEQGNSHDI